MNVLDANDLLEELLKLKETYGTLKGIRIDAYVTEEVEQQIAVHDLFTFSLVDPIIKGDVGEETLHSIQLNLGNHESIS